MHHLAAPCQDSTGFLGRLEAREWRLLLSAILAPAVAFQRGVGNGASFTAGVTGEVIRPRLLSLFLL